MNRFPIPSIGRAAAVLVLAGVAPAKGAEPAGGVPGEWLSRWSGGRTVGMGGAYVAWAQEPIAVHGLSFAVPGRKLPSFGLTVLSLSSGEFEKTNNLNEPLGSFHEGDLAFLFSTAKSLSSRFSVGTNLKVVRQSIDEFDGSGFGVDLGVLYNLTQAVRIGASVQNIGGPGIKLRNTEETWPTEIRGGVAAPILGGRGLVSAEIHHVPGPGTSVRGGTEYWVHPLMALRFGYQSAPAGGFSYRVAPDARLDYGVTTQELGVIHRFGISYRFGGFHAKSQARPEVFSPVGERPVTKFELHAQTKAETAKWWLEIEDEAGAAVRRFGGPGAPPAHVMWDGKNETGLPLPDGIYRYRLVVVDAEGRELAGHEQTVEIATSGPRGSIPVLVN
jgi:hypothetical protein